MKRIIKWLCLLLVPVTLWGVSKKKKVPFEGERPMVIVVPSYNNTAFCEQNLRSIYEQEYTNYVVIYVNDCSSDDTLQKVQKIVQEYDQGWRTIVINNTVRRGAMENLYKAIVSCDDRVVIVTVDGDDWLANSQVLSYLNAVYQNGDIWLTYGQYKEHPTGEIGFCSPFPHKVIRYNTFRKTSLPVSHLRTFYAGLFKRIDPKDLKESAHKFYSMAWDKAMMAPMLEMANSHHKFIQDVLYIYNNNNPINDHRVNEHLQHNLARSILTKPPYHPLHNPPFVSPVPLQAADCIISDTLINYFGEKNITWIR